ncbi:hypothetical protein [Salarchaeum japonicum]|uniref:Uncharacterized protein n=1 Tax=Salarchaeum japonicum TaxID=555573 RepID=A0AAV3T055_9EURY|nr:hypothetical protein [Salarchaeum japonicum]
MNRDRVRGALSEFAGSDAERRAVARAAGDLADSGRYEDATGRELTAAELLEHLRDAPEELVASRWNWWMGSLDLAYGGFGEFQVRRWRE